MIHDYHPITAIDSTKRRSPFTNIFRPLLLSNIWKSDATSMASEEYDYSTEKNTSKLVLEAEALRAQAKAIMAQALAMERELKESRSKVRNSKIKATDQLIEQWFRVTERQPNSICIERAQPTGSFKEDTEGVDIPMSIIANSTTVANRLVEENATPDQILQVVDRLFERQMEASGQTAFLQNGTYDLSDPNQNHFNETEYERLSDILETLVLAAVVVDERVNNSTTSTTSLGKRWSGRIEPAISARLNELRRTQKLNLDRKLMAEMKNNAKSTTGSGEEYVRRNLVGQLFEQTSTTNLGSVAIDEDQDKPVLFPLWVPSVFLPFINALPSPSFGPEHVKALTDQVLMGSKFYVTSHNSIPGAAIFRGNIRSTAGNKRDMQSTAIAFEDIQRRLEKIPSLRDRVQLFLLPDPEWKPKENPDSEPKPVLLAMSKEISPDESKMSNGLFLKLGKVRDATYNPPFIASQCIPQTHLPFLDFVVPVGCRHDPSLCYRRILPKRILFQITNYATELESVANDVSTSCWWNFGDACATRGRTLFGSKVARY